MNQDLILQLQDLGSWLDDNIILGGMSMNWAAVVQAKPIRVSGRRSKRCGSLYYLIKLKDIDAQTQQSS
jgi:hypothetical protein